MHISCEVKIFSYISVGYLHDYRRSLINVGYVLIKGKKVPFIGMVNMSVIL